MGWKSDWLYRRIFQHYEKLWQDAQAYDGKSGPPPVEILVMEYSKSRPDHWGCPRCSGERIRAWRYQNSVWELTDVDERQLQKNLRQGRFFHTALGWFHIPRDRQTVLLEHLFGPLYGAGFVASVIGQGRSGRLRRKPETLSWVS